MSHFYFPKCVWVLPTCQAMLPQISNWCPVIDLGSTTIYPATMWDPSLPKITAPFSQDCPNISPEDVSWKYKSGDPYSWRSYKSNSQNHLLDFYPTRYTHRIQGNNSPTTVTVDRTQVRKTSHLWEALLSKGSTPWTRCGGRAQNFQVLPGTLLYAQKFRNSPSSVF